MSASSANDYVIVGGGTAGCVLGSRLAQTGLSVAIIEAGTAEGNNPAILSPVGALTLNGTPLHHTYTTTPQKGLNGRTLILAAGRVLGGGSAVNYGSWTRGNKSNYDTWASFIGDKRWSYQNMVTFFRKSETYPDKTIPDQHGYEGPIRLHCKDRGYPLREPMRDILTSTGLAIIPDMITGEVNGFAPLVETFLDGQRQFAANEYDVSRCSIITSAHVARVTHENGQATGVELDDGRIFSANKEVIIASGAMRSPQVLLLSGIGPKEELVKHNIVQKTELPFGQGLHDHIGVALAFKLRNPENGYAMGSPKFVSLEFFKGSPMDFVTSTSIPDADIGKALIVDGRKYEVAAQRTDLEILSAYGSFPMDGSRIGFDAACMSPSSRGQVTLASTEAQDNPLVDPNYYTTEHDRAIIRHGVRTIPKMVASDAGQKVLEGTETPPGGLSAITLDSSDADIDEHLRKCCHSFNHMSGTCAMGRVVDADCRVKGFGNLRVVDASIMPAPVSGHLQAAVYGLAERAADIIIQQA